MIQKRNHLDYILPVVYGLCVFVFFWKYFPYHLHYKEQFQLFLFTKNYFIETCSHPGGFCNYVGRFFTQFFLFSFVGALLISCFLTGIQQLVYAITRRFSKHSAGLLLSFLPSLYYWYLFCDVTAQTGGLIALLLTLISTLVGISLKSSTVRRIYLFASIPVLYWLAGGVVLLSVLLLIWYEWHTLRSASELKPKNKLLTHHSSLIIFSSVAAICLVFLLPFIVKYFMEQYSLYRYWWGVNYVQFVLDSPHKMLYLWTIIILNVAGVLFLPKIKTMRTFVSYGIQIFVFLFSIYFVILKYAYPQNLPTKEIVAYDYYIRMQNWDKVIAMADQKSPTVPITVTSLNLALYKTGQLPDRMFHYFQNGPEGLLPTFQRDFLIPMVAGEPYWYLGFVNTAKRFAFEAMEALPDFQKSVRAIKRLTEANIVNGYYKVASKYLSLLENTLFYRNWARETRAFLYNEAKIDAHPEWGKIRRFRTEEDFFFSEREKDMMLGILFQQRRDNRMAYEYLMAYTLLTKNLVVFPDYFQMRKDFTYDEIPRSWQEALVYLWGLTNVSMDSIPFPISSSVKREVVEYARIYTTMQSPEPALRRLFSNTYWYYFHFRDFNRVISEQILQY